MQQRTYLRKMEKEDLDMVLCWRNQPEVRKFMYTERIITVEEHYRWFDRCLGDEKRVNLIFERDRLPLGFVSFYNIDERNKRANWAFYLGDKKIKVAGILMELTALEYAFKVLCLNKLCCEVLEFNKAVINLHKKFGFIQEGLYRQHYFRDEKYFDVFFLVLFARDWLNVGDKYFSKFHKQLFC